jgi:sugar phosphate isomerase/epimerase
MAAQFAVMFLMVDLPVMHSPLRPLALAHLCLLHCGPARLIETAAHAGFQAISLRLHPAAAGSPAYPMRSGDALFKETRSRLADTGLKVAEVEFVSLTADLDLATVLPILETGAELGAARLDVSGDDPDLHRLADRFGQLCDQARAFGMGVDLEFMRWRVVNDIECAARVVAAAARPNGRILLDALHLFRSGGRPEAVARLDPRLIGALQVSDAMAADPGDEGIVAEARGGRLLPGQGELALAELLAATPADIPLSAEIPMGLTAPGLSDQDLARLVYTATREWLHSAQPRGPVARAAAPDLTPLEKKPS